MDKSGFLKLCAGSKGPIGLKTYEAAKKELKYWSDKGPEGCRIVYVEVAPGGEAFPLSEGST